VIGLSELNTFILIVYYACVV